MPFVATTDKCPKNSTHVVGFDTMKPHEYFCRNCRPSTEAATVNPKLAKNAVVAAAKEDAARMKTEAKEAKQAAAQATKDKASETKGKKPLSGRDQLEQERKSRG